MRAYFVYWRVKPKSSWPFELAHSGGMRPDTASITDDRAFAVLGVYKRETSQNLRSLCTAIFNLIRQRPTGERERD
jgi:hypothetical protein